EILQQFGQEVEAARLGVPEVMMRVDDRQVGFQHLLRRPLGEPGGEIGVVAVGEAAIFAFCHVFPPGLWPTIAQEGRRSCVFASSVPERSAETSQRGSLMLDTRSRWWRAVHISRRSAPKA